MQYSVSECIEVSHAEADAFEDLGLVVASLREAVRVGNIEAIFRFFVLN
jgi:hypothetical protein